MRIFSALLVLSLGLVSILANAKTNCSPKDETCWSKTAVTNTEGSAIASIRVLKDLDPGREWKKVETAEGTCVIGGHKLTVGMPTDNWILGTNTMGWSANEGPFDAGIKVTLQGVNKDASDSWFQIRCISYNHWVQPEQFQEAVAGFLKLQFKLSK